MTIKLPEPCSIQMWVSYQGAQLTKTCATNLYTEAQLKQAIRDVLEDAAKEFEQFGGFEDGYSCASRLRQLKEQLE